MGKKEDHKKDDASEIEVSKLEVTKPELFELMVWFTSRGMSFPPGRKFKRAFFEQRGVDIEDHLKRNLIRRAK